MALRTDTIEKPAVKPVVKKVEEKRQQIISGELKVINAQAGEEFKAEDFPNIAVK